MALRILYNHMQAIICFEQVIACIVFSLPDMNSEQPLK